VPGLQKKTTVAGVAQRKTTLERLGVAFGENDLTHDHLDAAVGAIAAAASDGKVPGLAVVLLGEQLAVRSSGELEEGPMASLQVDRRLQEALSEIAGAGRDAVNGRPANRAARGSVVELACPIPGCTHVFKSGRGGWDAHVASRKVHPSWMPSESDGQRRKELFRRAFPTFFK
jgi:hypothetical protein